MRSSKLTVPALALATILSLFYAAAASQHSHSHNEATAKPDVQTSTATGGDASKQMMDAMMKGMQDMQGMQMMNDPDHDFAMMMMMHHESGIEMARIEAAQGKDPQMKAMAKRIIASQEKDNQQFKAWMAKKGHSMGHMKSMK